MDLRLINKETVRELLSMKRAIELMRDAYTSLSAGMVDSPLRTALVNDAGTVLYKPAYSDSAGVFCAKVVSVFADNVNKGLPVTPGIIIVNSAETGMPVALVEAGYLTSLRTGAATGLATDLFCAKGVKVAALFGTGGQSYHQLEAMLEVRDFETIYVFSRNEENAKRFCAEHQSAFPNCKLIANPSRDVLKQCEVITLATTSPVAVIYDEEISDNVHINAIGSLGPNRTEVGTDTMLRAKVYVDQKSACLAEAGEICLLAEAGLIDDSFEVTEIGEVLSRPSEVLLDGVSVFKSVGNAIQDLVCTAEVLRVAELDELGQKVSL